MKQTALDEVMNRAIRSSSRKQVEMQREGVRGEVPKAQVVPRNACVIIIISRASGEETENQKL
jgi:hypothetical protein